MNSKIINNKTKRHHDILNACQVDNLKYVCVDGGVRCGKTTYAVIGAINNLIAHALQNEAEYTDSNNALFVAKTLKQTRSILMTIAEEWLNELGVQLQNKQDYYYFEIASPYDQSIKKIRIYTASADNVSSQDAIQGLTVRVALLDEAVNFPDNFIQQVIQRTSSFSYSSKIIMLTNPAGDKSHSYYKKYIDTADKYINITTEEAGIVDIDTINKERLRLPEGTFRQRYLAEWVGANDDSAFPNFKVQYHKPIKSYEKYIFIDWGSKDSVAVVEFSKYEDKHIVTDIFYHSRRETNVQVTSPQLVEILKRMYNNHEMIYVDTAPDLVGQLQNVGLPAIGLANKSLASQYLRTKNLIDSEKLYFYRDLDPILEAQIKNARMSKDGKSIGKVNNASVSEEQQIHALDCLVYYAVRHFKMNGE